MSIPEGNGTDITGNTSTYGWANVSGYVYGLINPYNDSDWYKTYLVAGISYSIQMQGSTLDSYLVLRDVNGSKIVFSNYFGAGLTETISYTPSISGVYYLDAQSYWTSANNTGFYLLGISSTKMDDYVATSQTTSTLQLGQIRSGSIEMAADADWHRISLVAGQSYGVHLSGQLSGAEVKIFDQAGLDTGSAGAGQCIFTPSTSGIYYVEVSGQNLTDTGAYGLTVWALPTVSLTNLTIQEGNSGSTNTAFQVHLSATSPVDVSVVVNTVDETAVAGQDYQTVHTVIIIPAGSTSAVVNVPIFGNTAFQPNRGFEVNLSSPTNAVLGSNALGMIVDDDTPAGLILPTDPLYGLEWYLYTIRAEYAWALATGKGVKVGFFDQGIDFSNPDLVANTNVALGRVALTLAVGGAPVLSTDNHGTWVAGVVGAARDGVGVVGVAYDSQLVPIYTSDVFSPQYLVEIANAFSYAKNLDVLNNSWGFGNLLQSGTNWAFLDNAMKPLFAPAFAALQDLVANGRHGLGTVVVQSAGNSYAFGDDTNLHGFQNSRYIITVGSTDYFGHISPFSTNGASVLVSAPGGGGGGNFDSIITTDRVGAAGLNTGNYAFVDGTSFSAPVVSGVVALMMQANPNLGYRDVQQILAYTAQQVDVGVGTWRTNGANDWNGGGLHYNAVDHATGFGQIDALAAVRLAAGWNAAPQSAANLHEIVTRKVVNQPIPDNSPGGVSSYINVTESMKVERVDVTLNITHPFIGDLSILLTSPSGVTSFLLWRPSQGSLSAFGSSQNDIHFTFDTVLDWGESSVGLWMLNVADYSSGDVGLLSDWTLDIIGKAASNDHTFYYTNEYSAYVANDPNRGVLSDPNGGNDTINAAALGLDNRIDLSRATISLLNGTTLTIANGTTIKNAIGGDGNDVLIANPLGSSLRGMGGNDALVSGAGNDTLDGGAGTDSALFSGPAKNYKLNFGTDSWFVQDMTGVDGSDSIKNVENLKFANKTIITESKVPGSYADLPESLWHFFIVAFNAAPGVEYMNQLAEAYRYGYSVQEIVDVFTTKHQFTDVYPVTLSHTDMASALVTNIVKDSASAAVKQSAINDITAALDIGWTVGNVVYTVFGNLAGKVLSDPTWGTTAQQFQNEIAIAKYYTTVMNQSTTDLATLREVLAPVNQNTDISTQEHIVTLIGVALMA